MKLHILHISIIHVETHLRCPIEKGPNGLLLGRRCIEDQPKLELMKGFVFVDSQRGEDTQG